LGRLHVATNLIADARAHYHKYGESMRNRGTGNAAFEALEEFIEDTGDTQTINLWVTWLAELSDQEEALARVEELRSILIGYGIGPETIMDQVRTGEIASVDAAPATDVQRDPLAGAFLSTPESPVTPAVAPQEAELAATTGEVRGAESAVDAIDEPRHEPLDEPFAALESDISADVDGAGTLPSLPDFEPFVARDTSVGDASLETLDYSAGQSIDEASLSAADEVSVPDPTPLELGSVQWDDEAEELLAELNRPLEASWAAAGSETHDSPPVHHSPMPTDAELERDELPSAESVGRGTEPEPIEFAETPGRSRPERPWTDSSDLTDLETPSVPLTGGRPSERPYAAEVGEPDSTSYIGAVLGNDTPVTAWETAESDTFAPVPIDAGSPALSFETAEFDEPVEWPAQSAGFSAEPPMGDEVPEPAAAEPSEPDLHATAANEDGDAGFTVTEDASEASVLPMREPEYDDVELHALEAVEAGVSAAEGWEDEARAALDAAAARPEAEPEPVVEMEPVIELEPVAEPEPVVELEPVVEVEPEPVLEYEPEIRVEPTSQPDPAGDVEIEVQDLDDDVLPVVKNPFAPPRLPDMPRDQRAVTAAESEAMAVEMPAERAPSPGPIEMPVIELSPAAVKEPRVGTYDLSEMDGPFVEPRLAMEEDPEDAFRDWVQSASTGVLKRALPELENRSESEKALLVIHRLAHLEDSGVEFKARLVDTLEKLGRTEAAVDACLVLGSTFEAVGRPDDARAAYQRVLRLQPGNEEARVGIDLLGEAMNDEHAGEAVGVRPTPYMPDHVNGTDTQSPLDHRPRQPKSTNGLGEGHSNGHGTSTAPRPYSGVAGGAEASADFEQLLTEFRAKLHDKPGHSESTSRTELGASLKGMGRLDDAIRELQAAVREPSPPPMAFELLGEAFLEKGQGRIAIRLLEKALGSLALGDRELMGVLYQLGVAYESITEANKALICYERIFSVDIDYRDIQERILACSV
jgi:tetratricopeptide (TPR) repeat protein